MLIQHITITFLFQMVPGFSSLLPSVHYIKPFDVSENIAGNCFFTLLMFLKCHVSKYNIVSLDPVSLTIVGSWLYNNVAFSKILIFWYIWSCYFLWRNVMFWTTTTIIIIRKHSLFNVIFTLALSHSVADMQEWVRSRDISYGKYLMCRSLCMLLKCNIHVCLMYVTLFRILLSMMCYWVRLCG